MLCSLCYPVNITLQGVAAKLSNFFHVFPYEIYSQTRQESQPDSGQKTFFAARMEWDKARHEICLALQREPQVTKA